MILYIDGADAVGKSTLAKNLAKWLECDYVDLPLYDYFLDYATIDDKFALFKSLVKAGYRDIVSDTEKAWLNALGLIHVEQKYKDKNAVVVRSLISSAMFNKNEETEDLYNFLFEHKYGVGYSIVLDVNDQTRLERMTKRGLGEEEVKNGKVIHYNVKKAMEYSQSKGCNAFYIDTSYLSQEEVFEIAKQAILKNETLCNVFNLKNNKQLERNQL